MLKEGDLLKIDTACRFNGWCADRAIAVPIGQISPEKARLLKVAEETLRICIDLLPSASGGRRSPARCRSTWSRRGSAW